MRRAILIWVCALSVIGLNFLVNPIWGMDFPLPEAIISSPPVSSADLATSKPVAIFGLYNCRGWAGVIVVLENGTIVGPLSMKPDDAIAFAKKANIAPTHQVHLFPAQGECAKVSPYESQLRDQDTQST